MSIIFEMEIEEREERCQRKKLVSPETFGSTAALLPASLLLSSVCKREGKLSSLSRSP